MTRILIVEDLSETRRWLVEIARAAFPGCIIAEAVSMRAGITQAVTTAFDIALIDLGLPDGSDWTYCAKCASGKAKPSAWSPL